MFEKYEQELKLLTNASANREIKDINKEGKYIIYKGKQLLNLSSNDYLGFAEDKSIIKNFLANCDYSLGSASARLLTGTTQTYKELEALLTERFNKESSLLFNSGYHANVGIMSSLAGRKDVIFSDKLNHASMIDGMRLSGTTFHRYKHLDYEHLEHLLEKYRHQYETAIIASETVFSMDGDCADIKKLVELKKKYNAILILDEAHAFGVFGDKALGLAEESGLLSEVDLLVATFGKAIASMGAFAVGKKVLIDYLTNKARSFIFSTALPEINIAFSKYMLEEVIPNTFQIRKNMLEIANSFRQEISENGFQTGGNSQIVPIIIGRNKDTVDKCNKLQDSGYYILPIRHPTVPENTARMRISIRADITKKDLENITTILKIK